MISEADIERLKARAEAIAEQVKAERAKAREEKRARSRQKSARAREIKKLERRSARSTCDVRVAKTRASERAKCSKKKPAPAPTKAKSRKTAARRIKPRPVAPGARAPEMLGEVVQPKALPAARAPLALLPAAPPLKKRKVSGVRPRKGSAVAARPKHRRRAAAEARRMRAQRQPAGAPLPVIRRGNWEAHIEQHSGKYYVTGWLKRPDGTFSSARSMDRSFKRPESATTAAVDWLERIASGGTAATAASPRASGRAVALYRGGINGLTELAVRDDGQVYQRYQDKTPRGYRWGAWKNQNRKMDVTDLPIRIESGFSTLTRVLPLTKNLRLPTGGLEAPLPKVGSPKPPRQALEDPAIMSAAAINKELDKLDAESSRNTDAFIEAGRGNERPSDYLKKDDPLSLEAQRIWDRQRDLRAEIGRRYGPGAPSRLPRGMGPIKGLAAAGPIGELHKEPVRRPGGNMAFARMEQDGMEIELARDPSGNLVLLVEGVPGPPLRGTKRLAGSEITGSKAKDAAIYKEFSRLLGMSKIQRPSANPVEAGAEKARRGFESSFRSASSLIERYARGEAERADAVRARELADLRAAERAGQPIPGSYEHELAVMRGGSSASAAAPSFSLAPTEQARPSAAKKSAAERTVSMFEPAVMHQRGRRGTLAAPPAINLEVQAAPDERSREARGRPMTVEARYDRENDWPIVTINNWAGPSGNAGDVRATWPPNAAEGVAVLRRESGEAVILKGADLHAAMSIALPKMALLIKKELVEEAGPRSIELSDRYDLMSGTKKPAKKRGGGR